MKRVPRTTTTNAPSRAAATNAVLHVLGARGTGDAGIASDAVLAWCDNGSGRPSVAIDERRIVRFVRTQRSALLRQLRHRDVRRRHLTIWALGVARDTRSAEQVIAAHDRHANWFTHDYVFAAARRFGAKGVAAFERIATTTRGRSRDLAIACLGTSRSGLTAITSLRRIVRRLGCSSAVLNSIYNLHDPRGIGLVLPPLTSDDPLVHDAVHALLGCLEAAKRSSQVRHRRRATAALHALFTSPEMLESPGDP